MPGRPSSSSRSLLWWLLPAATGAAAYFLTLHLRQQQAAAHHPAPTTAASVPAPRPSLQLKGDGVAEAFSETERSYYESLQDSATASVAADPQDPEAIRQRLLEIQKQVAGLKKELNTSENIERLRKLDEEASRLAHELGKLGAEEALKWIATHDNDPALRNAVFQEWVQSDPQAAWQHLLASTQPDPCHRDTFIHLISVIGNNDPALLKAAVEAAPWHLLDSGYILNQSPLSVPSDADYHLWVDSGAARAAIEQGVTLYGIFPRWLQDAPQDALAAWASWPSPDLPKQSDVFLIDILQDAWRGMIFQANVDPSRAGGPDVRTPLAQALSNADPEVTARLAESLARLQQQPYAMTTAIDALKLRESVPALFPAAAPANTGDGH